MNTQRKISCVIVPMLSGMPVTLNGYEYSFIDGMVFRGYKGKKVYCGISLNSFISLCNFITDEEAEARSKEFFDLGER